MKKKILFVINDLGIFRGFFRADILHIAKDYDVYFLIYKYGFQNKDYKKYQINWMENLQKKKIVKKVIWLDEVSYSNFHKNIIFNKNFIKIIKDIKILNIDYFLLTNLYYYWEEIIFHIFKDKKIFCYLTNAPTGVDFFKNFKELKKSLKFNRILKSFSLNSDNSDYHRFNTRPLNNYNFFIFIFQKLNIALSKLLNHYFIPIILIKRTIKIKSIYYKLNLNFFDFDKIIIFGNEFKKFLLNLNLKKNTKIYLCSKYNQDKQIKNYNWVYTYSSAKDKQVLSKLFNYLKILKKLKKINYVYFKGHPTWKHEIIEKNFFKKLKQSGIKFKFIDNYKKVDFLKYYGLISAPSTVLSEALYNNPNLKIIGIRKNKYITSGLLYKFYKYKKKLFGNLKFLI